MLTTHLRLLRKFSIFQEFISRECVIRFLRPVIPEIAMKIEVTNFLFHFVASLVCGCRQFCTQRSRNLDCLVVGLLLTSIGLSIFACVKVYRLHPSQAHR